MFLTWETQYFRCGLMQPLECFHGCAALAVCHVISPLDCHPVFSFNLFNKNVDICIQDNLCVLFLCEESGVKDAVKGRMTMRCLVACWFPVWLLQASLDILHLKREN